MMLFYLHGDDQHNSIHMVCLTILALFTSRSKSRKTPVNAKMLAAELASLVARLGSCEALPVLKTCSITVTGS